MQRNMLMPALWSLLLASCSLQTASGGFYGAVSGSVSFEGGDVREVTVTLSCLDDDDIADRTVRAGEDGGYFFDRVENSIYSVTARAENSSEGTRAERVAVSNRTVTVPRMRFTSLAYENFASDFDVVLSADSALAVSREVTVSVECRSEEPVTVLRYALGVHSALYFESGYGTLLSCRANLSSVQIVQNGSYTFYARSSDGKTGMKVIEISSIDTDSPEPVTDVRASYSGVSGKLEVEWRASSSDDVQCVEVVLSRKESVETMAVGAGKTSCAFACDPDGSSCTVTLCAVDSAGNRSPSVSVTCTASAEPCVYELWFDRTRMTVTEATVTVFVRGCNFLQAESGSFVVRRDSGGSANGSEPVALTVTGPESAWCTLPVPDTAGSYAASAIYRDCVLREERFTVCELPSVSLVELGTLSVSAGHGGGCTVTLRGSDLDLCRSCEVTVSRDGSEVLTCTALPVSSECLACSFVCPAEEGLYAVSCTVDGRAQDARAVLTVHGAVTVESVPDVFAPLINCGKYAEVIVRGKNLDVADAAVAVVCNGRRSEPYSVSYAECRVRVAVPSVASPCDFALTVVAGGAESEVSGTLHVQDTCGYVDSHFALVTVCSGTVSVGKKGSSLLPSGTSLAAYEISRYPMTRGLWYAVYEWALQNGYGFAGSYEPVPIESMVPLTDVSWRDAVVWCNAFTEWHNAFTSDGTVLSCVYYTDSACTVPLRKSSADSSLLTAAGAIDNPYVKKNAKGFRLPSCAEWELAFRGGSWADSAWDYEFSGSSSADDVAWYDGNSGFVLHQAGLKGANRLGLYDMSGTVWEWTADWAYTNVQRRLRGGSFKSGQSECGAQDEGLGKIPYYTDGTWGFRVARNK